MGMRAHRMAQPLQSMGAVSMNIVRVLNVIAVTLVVVIMLVVVSVSVVVSVPVMIVFAARAADGVHAIQDAPINALPHINNYQRRAFAKCSRTVTNSAQPVTVNPGAARRGNGLPHRTLRTAV